MKTLISCSVAWTSLGYFLDLLLLHCAYASLFIFPVALSKFCPWDGRDQSDPPFFFLRFNMCVKAHIECMSKKISCSQTNTKLATHQVQTILLTTIKLKDKKSTSSPDSYPNYNTNVLINILQCWVQKVIWQKSFL